MDLSNEDWHLATATLREHSLLAAVDPREPETLDAHPLVRACFAEELESHRPDAWQEGNRRLYEHLRQAAPDLPDTLEAMQPLYAAVVHGCRAGRQQEAVDEVFWRRIRRGEQALQLEKARGLWLGADGAGGLLRSPLVPALRPPHRRMDQAFVLHEAAFRLRALGRLTEALDPMENWARDGCIKQENWNSAAPIAGNLSGLALTLGDVAAAVGDKPSRP